jgi:hypothetical protein
MPCVTPFISLVVCLSLFLSNICDRDLLLRSSYAGSSISARCLLSVCLKSPSFYTIFHRSWYLQSLHVKDIVTM